MKLSMWSSYYMDLSPEDAILQLEENGYSYCELSDEHAAVLLSRGDAVETGKTFEAFCKAHHVSVLQGHLFLSLRLCDESQPVVEILKKWLDLFCAIGIQQAVLHCDGMYDSNLTLCEKREKNAAVLCQLTDYLKDKELVICLENLPRFCQNAEELLWYIDTIGSDHLGICLDTGHLNLTQYRDQPAFIRKAGEHLKALHIADNEGERDQHMMPFGRGNVDIEAVVAALAEIGYNNLINLEIPGERDCPLEVRGYKLQYIKQVFNYLSKKVMKH